MKNSLKVVMLLAGITVANPVLANKTYVEDKHPNHQHHQQIQNYDKKHYYHTVQDEVKKCLKMKTSKNDWYSKNHHKNYWDMKKKKYHHDFFSMEEFTDEFNQKIKEMYEQQAKMMMLLTKADSNFDGIISGTEIGKICQDQPHRTYKPYMKEKMPEKRQWQKDNSKYDMKEKMLEYQKKHNKMKDIHEHKEPMTNQMPSAKTNQMDSLDKME
jgi:thiol:disulfide interchange protein